MAELDVVPFNRPTIAPKQQSYLQEVAHSGHWAGDGEFTRRSSLLLSGLHQRHSVLLTTSCTAALEMSALLLGLEPGDEVIVPSFTFVSSANAFALMGARIVFADIRPDTWTIDPDAVDALIGPRTRAIVAVHYGGSAPDLARLTACAASHGVMLIEDNAHGLFGATATGPLGCAGAVSTLSFHETKNVACGEGGALVLNDPSLVERAEILREKGTNRSRFFRGMVDKYTWVDLGSSYLMAEFTAAVLLAQLEFASEIQRRRRAIVQRYRTDLPAWMQRVGAEPHVVVNDVESFHLFAFLMPDLETRQRFLAYCRARGVTAVFHYLPLDASPAGEQHGTAPRTCPVTAAIADRLVRLPVFNDMTATEVDRVVDAVISFED
jgi:dTDP-4-amino-4,6-dideoxygalactose transaminase